MNKRTIDAITARAKAIALPLFLLHQCVMEVSICRLWAGYALQASSPNAVPADALGPPTVIFAEDVVFSLVGGVVVLPYPEARIVLSV